MVPQNLVRYLSNHKSVKPEAKYINEPKNQNARLNDRFFKKQVTLACATNISRLTKLSLFVLKHFEQYQN